MFSSKLITLKSRFKPRSFKLNTALSKLNPKASIFHNVHAETDDVIILLHGLARTNRSMFIMSKALEKSGYHCINVNYPSLKYAIDKLANDAISTAIEQCPKQATIHFVTHSMGGILVRQYLSQHSINNLGRVVMLAPPNKGSQIIDKISSWPQLNAIHCPASKQLNTAKNSLPNSLCDVNFELGIIAGTRHINPLASHLIPEPHDGKVSVESSKVKGMSAHIELAVSHTYMMMNRKVITHVISFIQTGKFLN